jgi:NADH:ubiquinone oxidoreductase subunit 6 (subunit J)
VRRYYGDSRLGELQVASDIVQLVLIASTLAFALMAAGMDNILFAALSLGGMSICLGGLYWTMYAPYVGLFQLLIYGGAVVVLFVSVVMFVRSEESE